MKKRKKRNDFTKPIRPSNLHFENLIELRDRNPQGFNRLGEGSNQAVERYEAEQLSSTFEYRDGTERLLDLRERLPKVFDRFSDQTKRLVNEYAERKRAYEIVNGLSSRQN